MLPISSLTAVLLLQSGAMELPSPPDGGTPPGIQEPLPPGDSREAGLAVEVPSTPVPPSPEGLPVPTLVVDAAAPAGCVVVVSRSEGLAPGEAAQVAERVGAALRGDGVPVNLSQEQVSARSAEEVSRCQGDLPCLAAVGRSLGAGAVVVVDVARVFGNFSYELALIDLDSGRSLADKLFAARMDSPLVDAELAEFARTTRFALLTLPGFSLPAPAPDSPRIASLTPSPTLPVQAPPAPPLPVAAYAVTGGAVVAGVATGIFGAMTYQLWSRTVPDAQNRISLRQSELPTYQRNQLLTGLAGGACAALTGAAVYLWLHPPAANP